MALTANPSVPLGALIVVAADIAALAFVAPALLVLASFVGLVHFDINMLFVALPALAAAVALGLLGHAKLRELLFLRPVLSVDGHGILDRRTMLAPLPWSNVSRATSIVAGGGGVVFDLKEPIPTFTMGSLRYEAPEAGAAHVNLRGMTMPAEALASRILELAAGAGIETAEARAHEKVRRRSWSV